MNIHGNRSAKINVCVIACVILGNFAYVNLAIAEVGIEEFRSALAQGEYSCNEATNSLTEKSKHLLVHPLSSVVNRTSFYSTAGQSVAIFNALLESEIKIMVVEDSRPGRTFTRNLVLKNVYDRVYIGNDFPFYSDIIGEHSRYLLMSNIAHEIGHLVQNKYKNNIGSCKSKKSSVRELQADIIGGYLVAKSFQSGFRLHYHGWAPLDPWFDNEPEQLWYECGPDLMSSTRMRGDDINILSLTDEITPKYRRNITSVQEQLKIETEPLLGPDFFVACSTPTEINMIDRTGKTFLFEESNGVKLITFTPEYLESIPERIEFMDDIHILQTGAMWSDYSSLEGGDGYGSIQDRFMAVVHGWKLADEDVEQSIDINLMLSNTSQIAENISDAQCN